MDMISPMAAGVAAAAAVSEKQKKKNHFIGMVQAEPVQ